MDAKITLSFDSKIIKQAKEYAADQGISLSRLTEILLRKLTSGNYNHIEDFPVEQWVSMVSEGEAEYITAPASSKKRKAMYFESRKKK